MSAATKFIFCLILITGITSSSTFVFGQVSDSKTLFSLDGTPVKVGEFRYVYEKNNADDEKIYSKSSLAEYLKLYVDFRLKVREAEEMGLNKDSTLIKELAMYRNQLAQSYLFDNEVNEKLMKEAYDRLGQEVKASHILISIPEPGLPADTLLAYQKALELKKKIDKGAKFEDLALQQSADPSAKDNLGNIGYFTAFQTVYAFESVAFNTKVGAVSMPVRTQFGYHLVKVADKRPASGETTVAHILIRVPKTADEASRRYKQEQAESVYQQAIAGKPFEELVKIYSEDNTTKKTAGLLPPVTVGRMVEEFETAVFALKEDGEISKPVLTSYGWHIIRRVSRKEVASYEDSKSSLKAKVERDTRSAIAKSKLVNNIKLEYKYKEYPTAKEALFAKIGDGFGKGAFSMEDKSGLDSKLFELKKAKKTWTQKDFVRFLESKQKRARKEDAQKIFDDYYAKFVEQRMLDYEKSQLDKKNEDFRNLMKEYRDGILLFELTDRKVWNKAIKDTTGLKAFHEKNRNNYMWGERLYVDIYTSKDQAIAQQGADLARNMNEQELIANFTGKDDEQLLKVQTGKFEEGQNNTVDNAGIKSGISRVIRNSDGNYSFVVVKEILSPEPKSLNEAKGFIVSDYQNFLLEEWVKELREKYPVETSDEVVSALIKK